MKSLEVGDDDKEDDFNFDSLVIASSSKISHYNITPLLQLVVFSLIKLYINCISIYGTKLYGTK